MKLKEFLFHMLTFGSEKRRQKAHKEEREFFFSTQNIDPGLFEQKEVLHFSIPTGSSISRIATSGRGAGVGGIHKISSLVPWVKSRKESGAVLGTLHGLLCSKQSIPIPPRRMAVSTVISLGLWHVGALCSAHSGSLALPLLWPAVVAWV